MEKLLDLIRPYVSEDDVELDKKVFLRMIADRILDDIEGIECGCDKWSCLTCSPDRR
jgi:hypothetical protein